ncbi:MAG: phosphoribosylamine--glycine ligase, partial [Arenicellales bacterium WSBS_2016_MAG_OTU3]
IMREIIEPTVQGLLAEGIPYTGFLYAGLMISPDGSPKVIEFNVRLGDPETQPIMMRLKSDLLELIEAALDGRLHELTIEWDPRPALGVVMATATYPEGSGKGAVIAGIDDANALEDVTVFHAGTRLADDGSIVSNGGRVLCVTALGSTVADAQSKAYAGVSKIRFENADWRTDIGYRAVEREKG